MGNKDVNISAMSNILDNKIHTIIENIIISTLKVNDNDNTNSTNTNSNPNETIDKDHIWLVLAIKGTVNANKKIIFRLVYLSIISIDLSIIIIIILLGRMIVVKLIIFLNH